MTVPSVEAFKSLGINCLKAIAIVGIIVVIYWVAKQIFEAIVDLILYYRAQSSVPPKDNLFQDYYNLILPINDKFKMNDLPKEIKEQWILWKMEVQSTLQAYYQQLKELGNRPSSIQWTPSFKTDAHLLIPFERLELEAWLSFCPHYPFRIKGEYPKITYLDFIIGGPYHD